MREPTGKLTTTSTCVRNVVLLGVEADKACPVAGLVKDGFDILPRRLQDVFEDDHLDLVLLAVFEHTKEGAT